MRIISSISIALALIFLIGCSPVKNIASHEYQLSAFSKKRLAANPSLISLMVTPPEAVSGYQTDQMIYIEKPYQIQSFAKNEWVSPPAEMLYPLLVQSLQDSGYFYAIASSPNTLETDYRLDTQLLNLEQSFLKKPSFIQLKVKVVLTRINDNKVIASRIISLQIPCPADTPYGGVLAANKASFEFTSIVTRFVINHLKDRS